MKYKTNPESDGNEYRILQGSRGKPKIEAFFNHLNRHNKIKVTFGNFYDEKKGECRLCHTKCIVKNRSKDGDPFLVAEYPATGKSFLHRRWARDRKRMFCVLEDGTLQIAFAISKMRGDQTEDLSRQRSGSHKADLIKKIKDGLKMLNEEDRNEINTPTRLTSWNSIKLSGLLETIQEISGKW